MAKWKRGQKIKLSNNFSSSEFECSCGKCIDQEISDDLIKRLQDLRERLSAPIKITSAFRCADKQASLRASGILTAKGKSTHELGHAVDIYFPDMKKLRAEVDKLFDSIGEAKGFLHVDIRPKKSDGSKRIWKY